MAKKYFWPSVTITPVPKRVNALSAFQQAFEQVINQFPDGLYQLDNHHRVMTINDAALKYWAKGV